MHVPTPTVVWAALTVTSTMDSWQNDVSCRFLQPQGTLSYHLFYLTIIQNLKMFSFTVRYDK